MIEQGTANATITYYANTFTSIWGNNLPVVDLKTLSFPTLSWNHYVWFWHRNRGSANKYSPSVKGVEIFSVSDRTWGHEIKKNMNSDEGFIQKDARPYSATFPLFHPKSFLAFMLLYVTALINVARSKCLSLYHKLQLWMDTYLVFPRAWNVSLLRYEYWYSRWISWTHNPWNIYHSYHV